MTFANDLLAYYSLEEVSGAVRNSSHGDANVLTQNAASVGQSSGHIGNCATFSNRLLYSAVSSPLEGGGTDWSFGIWYRPSTQTIWKMLAGCQNDNSAANSNWIIQHYDANSLSVWLASGGSWTSANSTINITNATWNYVYAQYKATTNMLGISVNNETLVESENTLGTPNTGGHRFNLGGMFNEARFMDGYLDEAHYHTRNLSAAERSWQWNGGDGRSYADIG